MAGNAVISCPAPQGPPAALVHEGVVERWGGKGERRHGACMRDQEHVTAPISDKTPACKSPRRLHPSRTTTIPQESTHWSSRDLRLPVSPPRVLGRVPVQPPPCSCPTQCLPLPLSAAHMQASPLLAVGGCV
ncbi:hypothetical protein NDU88_002032 [Pleurodeles waltl]|uniref:Uncharacterized protein n=1 Tax=Pleurodeles waltl TaxID=8319 RepID=A0AAV7U8I1_PLEWA|nr:hypothetical protein NDU88_002032 [Pleurodeles waltl]